MAINYQIKLGDCIFCVIKQHGLLPDDVLFIPNIRVKEVK
jgi:hypothetical protein